jgi:hypothetical protein
MNLDDYRGRLLARAFHDELEKIAGGFANTINSFEAEKAKDTKKSFSSTMPKAKALKWAAGSGPPSPAIATPKQPLQSNWRG